MFSVWAIISCVLLVLIMWLTYALQKEREQNLCLANELIAVKADSLSNHHSSELLTSSRGEASATNTCFFSHESCAQTAPYKTLGSTHQSSSKPDKASRIDRRGGAQLLNCSVKFQD
ncbi:MAG: hypothetical protein JRE16_11015 [Deltaproteobacteria bacterium]|jgi:type II secretory pathway pseudopilin PulG|nr:hypothetical protein [Deltaproteobacteria bacterium]MBW2476475.1 hypothetical protein [Deltaproteobacteria bacterium]MBW2505084.1 hypothetical protein [Deltaproteobacteria bacterium]MBW2520552.1 hypothetical protein [Deltaproteobacteria bacterium]